MEKGLIGRKLGMTQIFAADGASVPVTVIEAGPCYAVSYTHLTLPTNYSV